MKHCRLCLLPALLLATLAFAGCGPKATWLPLWSTPMPGRTAAATVQPTPTPEGETSAEAGSADLFATDAEKMDSPRIVVYKSKHILEVYDGDTLMARLRVSVGKSGEGAKEKSGDNRTPEGEYYICKKSESEKYYKSLFISYPNAADAQKGLEEGRITQEQYDEIAGAVDRREQPLWDTDLGGEIAISGTGPDPARTGDWTSGSVAVSDGDMDYLWRYIEVGTDVVINP